MQVRELFQESAGDDARMHKEARDAAVRVADRIYNGSAKPEVVDLNDEPAYFFYPTDLGLPYKCLFFFTLKNPNAIGISAYIGPLREPVRGYKRALIVYGLRSFTEESLRSTVNSTEFLEDFTHEVIHLLDAERTNDRILDRESDSKNLDNYYNDPAEFNAFFHMVANPFLGLISEIERSPHHANDLMNLYDLTGDFKHDLRVVLRTPNIHLRRFIKHLTPDRRKSMLKRLWRIHAEMMRTVRSAQATQPPAMADAA